MTSMIYESKFEHLPNVLKGGSEGVTLSDDELLGLRNRLGLVEQLAYELAEWKMVAGTADGIAAFIDRIELHSALCLALPEGASGYSWWVAHNGWRPLKARLPNFTNASVFLRQEVPSLLRQRDEFDAWATMASKSIISALEEFYSAADFAKVWMQIVLINSMIALVFSGISRQRFEM